MKLKIMHIIWFSLVVISAAATIAAYALGNKIWLSLAIIFCGISAAVIAADAILSGAVKKYSDAKETIVTAEETEALLDKRKKEAEETLAEAERENREAKRIRKSTEDMKADYIRQAKEQLRDEYYPVLEKQYHKKYDAEIARAEADKAEAEATIAKENNEAKYAFGKGILESLKPSTETATDDKVVKVVTMSDELYSTVKNMTSWATIVEVLQNMHVKFKYEGNMTKLVDSCTFTSWKKDLLALVEL